MPDRLTKYAFADPEHRVEHQPQFFIPPSSGTAANGLPILDWDQGAAQLTRSGTSWSGTLGAPVTVTYAFRVTGVSDPGLGVTGFQQFNSVQIAVAEEALRLWGEVANINFVRVGTGSTGPAAYSNNASILFGNFVNGGAAFSAFTYLPSPTATAPADFEGDIWVNISRDYDANPAAFPQGARILAHEIGHALGFEHPGNYDGGANSGVTYGDDADVWQDTGMFSNMSYFDEEFTGANYGTLAFAPQMFDIAAAQRLYGANMTTRTGDTVYGFNSNAGHAVFRIDGPTRQVVFSIWDAGGTDTLDLSGYNTNSNIDLREEAFSSAGPSSVYNISIARGAIVENAIGGAGADTITGNAVANVLNGGAGNDGLYGLSGDDTLIGGAGADKLEGGAGVDTVSYAGSAGGVIVRLWNNTVSGGDALGDTITGFENITGGNGADSLVGSDSVANVLNGGAGNDGLYGLSGDDTLIGGAGADKLEGGAGVDTVSYAGSAGGVIVRLWNNTVSGGDALGDTITGFENITGGNGADSLVGSDSVANVLNGGAGNDGLYGLSGDDTLIGGAGADKLEGGAGVDTVSYAGSAGGVIVRLWNNTVSGGDALGDTITGFENITGGNGADSLVGSDSVANVLNGGAGNDGLYGLSGDDTLIGGAGADKLEGGAGVDTVSYAGSAGGVIVRLWNNTVSGGDALGDTITGFENITGGNGADSLVGSDSVANVLNGGAGNDGLYGLSGDDTLIGGAGADKLEGGAGADAFVFTTAGGAGNVDVITDFTAVDDTIQLSRAVFDVAAGTLAASAFVIGAAAADGDDRIVYNSATGALYYDADGNGAGAMVQIATLTAALPLTNDDFFGINP